MGRASRPGAARRQHGGTQTLPRKALSLLRHKRPFLNDGNASSLPRLWEAHHSAEALFPSSGGTACFLKPREQGPGHSDSGDHLRLVYVLAGHTSLTSTCRGVRWSTVAQGPVFSPLLPCPHPPCSFPGSVVVPPEPNAQLGQGVPECTRTLCPSKGQGDAARQPRSPDFQTREAALQSPRSRHPHGTGQGKANSLSAPGSQAHPGRQG